MDVAPLLVGVAPFGLVAGATPLTHGMSWEVAVGFSTIVFAGASQLVAIDVLAGGGSALVAIVAACAINLRMVLYSASLAPHVTRTSMRRRLVMSYLLTDQVYALSIVRLAGRWQRPGADEDREEDSFWWYYLGSAAGLWTTWQVSTVVGVLAGAALPSDLHLEFAVPLVFLVLLIPTLVDAPALAAALVGGTAAVVSAGLGAGPTSIVIGSVVGVIAGTVVDAVTDTRVDTSVETGEGSE